MLSMLGEVVHWGDSSSIMVQCSFDLLNVLIVFISLCSFQSIGSGKTNSWRRKHQTLIRSLDICLKTIVWQYYEGIKSHVNFATFFLLNARMLELMTLQVYHSNFKEEFFTRQREKLQLDKKASGGARLHFTTDHFHGSFTDFCGRDLDLADPFERNYPYQFHAFS